MNQYQMHNLKLKFFEKLTPNEIRELNKDRGINNKLPHYHDFFILRDGKNAFCVSIPKKRYKKGEISIYSFGITLIEIFYNKLNPTWFYVWYKSIKDPEGLLYDIPTTDPFYISQGINKKASRLIKKPGFEIIQLTKEQSEESQKLIDLYKQEAIAYLNKQFDLTK